MDTLRLSPLAFPRNPYHSLVKHYKDGGLVRSQRNDPALDSELALKLFRDERKALSDADPDLLTAWHWLCTPDTTGADRALDALFSKIRGARRPSAEEARAAVGVRLDGIACATHGRAVFDEASTGWALAYALAWLSVAGGNSVMPPWVRHQFPEAGQLVRRLRDTPCSDPACGWCRERHDAGKELKRWFPKLKGFRPEPEHDGRPMQQAIVEAAMRGEHVLGILPTGTGKSLCYQLPALSRYDKTGALTVVISPLVALMKDQVDGLEARGIGACVTVNGLLSMPERADALDRVRLGDAGILIIAPEQLRSRSVRRALDQREIGAWVVDEAHCLSRWGHDFRPDYLYVGRFIREKAGEEPPPVMCLTATAKPDVVEDVCRHFRDKLGIELTVFNGGAERTNLGFEVIPTSGGEKFEHIHQVLTSDLPPGGKSGAIVYCATRRRTEDVAEYLQLKDVAADYFHGDLPPETKKDVQRRFIGGELRAIAATNAFGMGIDKPDVRLVIHADIPGSLENYFQEAGRAGRDREPARCVLFYAPDDVERQFGLSARARLTSQEIQAVLRALRRLDRKKRLDGEVVATAGEILGEDEDKTFERDSATDDTRVRTAVAWLEESALLKREENAVRVFPSSLRVDSVERARALLERADIADTYRKSLLRIASALIEADADESLTTDELMGVSGLSPEGVRGALYDLERLGIASNDTALTAFVHHGIERSSRRRLDEAEALETGLIAHMREAAPELDKGETAPLHLRIAAQTLRDTGLAEPLPERLWRIVRGLSHDGRGEDGAGGSLSIRKQDAETVTSNVMCQGEGGSDSLTFVFVCEDGEQDSVHGGFVLEGSHGSCPPPDFAESSFDGVGGPDLLALGNGFVAEACEEFVEIVAQAGDGLGVDGFPAIGEAARRALGLAAAAGVHDGVGVGLDGVPVGLADLVEDVAHLVCPASLNRDGVIDDGQGGEQALAAIDADRLQALASEAAAVQAGQEALPLGGALAGGEAEVDDLLPAVGPDAERHQDRPPERAGAGLAGEHHAVEHQRLVGVLQRAAVEGRDRRVERPGDPADGRGRDRAAEQAQQDLADLAGRQPQHEAGQDRPVDLRRAPCIAPQNPGRAEAPGARHVELDVAELAQQAAPVAAVAPVAHGAPVETVEPAVHRLGHPALDNLGQRAPAERAVALAPVQTARLHLLHDLEGHR